MDIEKDKKVERVDFIEKEITTLRLIDDYIENLNKTNNFSQFVTKFQEIIKRIEDYYARKIGKQIDYFDCFYKLFVDNLILQNNLFKNFQSEINALEFKHDFYNCLDLFIKQLANENLNFTKYNSLVDYFKIEHLDNNNNAMNYINKKFNLPKFDVNRSMNTFKKEHDFEEYNENNPNLNYNDNQEFLKNNNNFKTFDFFNLLFKNNIITNQNLSNNIEKNQSNNNLINKIPINKSIIKSQDQPHFINEFKNVVNNLQNYINTNNFNQYSSYIDFFLSNNIHNNDEINTNLFNVKKQKANNHYLDNVNLINQNYDININNNNINNDQNINCQGHIKNTLLEPTKSKKLKNVKRKHSYRHKERVKIMKSNKKGNFIKPKIKITECPHIDRTHYARGKCRVCYQQIYFFTKYSSIPKKHNLEKIYKNQSQDSYK